MSELELLREVYRTGLAMRKTPVVDDEFPEMMHYFDSALRTMERLSEEGMKTFDLISHLTRQIAFSEKTFGPASRKHGVVDHIRSELEEIEENPSDLSEWIDVIILGFDGAWRAGHSAEEIVNALVAKQTKNENRNWPDWRTAEDGKAIEHIK